MSRTVRCRVLVLLCVLVCSSVPGCVYLCDRALDLTDVIDVRYGLGLGAGAKVKVTEYVGTFVGIGLYGNSEEWYGRRMRRDGGMGLGIGIIGVDGIGPDGYTEGTCANLLLYRAPLDLLRDESWEHRAKRPPHRARWRFGGEVLIPVVKFGLYVNVVEIADFLVGFGGLDIANDDGVYPGAPLDSTPESYPLRKRTKEEENASPPRSAEDVPVDPEAVRGLIRRGLDEPAREWLGRAVADPALAADEVGWLELAKDVYEIRW